MTSTQKTRTAQDIRREWISGWVDAVATLRAGTDPRIWAAIVHALDSEGPGLADPTNEWWPRRFAHLRMRYNCGVDPREVVVQALSDMYQANQRNGR